MTLNNEGTLITLGPFSNYLFSPLEEGGGWTGDVNNRRTWINICFGSSLQNSADISVVSTGTAVTTDK